MIKIAKQRVGESAAVYVIENAPPEFDSFLKRVVNECSGLYHKFISGKYKDMNLKEAIYRDGKQAVIEISQYLEKTYNPEYFNELKIALKYFIKSEKKEYSLEDVLLLANVLSEEIEEYQNKFGLNINAEIENLDEETKNKIRDYILF